MFKKLVSKVFKEKYLFYLVLGINVLLILTTKFHPTLDGPSHLYNSNLICHLIKGDSETITNFFAFNSFYIPNLTSHFILSALNFIFPSIIAEKGLLLLYLVGLALSFRLFVSHFSNDVRLSFFIFPFSYSLLFYMGFYNYTLSFILLFYIFYFFAKNVEDTRLIKYFKLSLLLLLAYYTSVLTYGFLGLILGLYTIATSIENSRKLHTIIRKLGLLLLVSLPGLVLLYLFYFNTPFSASTEKPVYNEMFRWIMDARAFIVFNYNTEGDLTRWFMPILLIIVIVSLFLRFKERSRIKASDILLIPILISVFLLFNTPNGSGAGMMSDRYILLFYMLLIMWVCIQKIPVHLASFLAFAMVCLHLGLLFKRTNGTIRNQDKYAQEIVATSKFIEPNSIVLAFNFSDYWLHKHFSNYLGVSKPVIILDNYEAGMGWFPLNWNIEKMPNIVLDNKTSIDGIIWTNNYKSTKLKQIDYVFIYGDINKINESSHNELKNILFSQKYKLVHSTDDNFINLYKRI